MSFVTFEDVENLPNQPETVLVDVRDPPEIKDTGKIPTSINIPCKSYLFWPQKIMIWERVCVIVVYDDIHCVGIFGYALPTG